MPTPKDRSPLPVSVPERKPESLAFMQWFIVELMNIVDQRQDAAGHKAGGDTVEPIGLTAGTCLEEMARRNLGHDKAPLSIADYADVFVAFKYRIGGAIVLEQVDSDTVPGVSGRCPFGERVKAAPNLCHMTSSVFGGIAARSFGFSRAAQHRPAVASCVGSDRRRGVHAVLAPSGAQSSHSRCCGCTA